MKTRLLKEAVDNLRGLIALTGFVALETGLTAHWSWPVAAMAGGPVLMLIGSWPYLLRTLRTK